MHPAGIEPRLIAARAKVPLSLQNKASSNFSRYPFFTQKCAKRRFWIQASYFLDSIANILIIYSRGSDWYVPSGDGQEEDDLMERLEALVGEMNTHEDEMLKIKDEAIAITKKLGLKKKKPTTKKHC
jgi:hypothetical protein